MKKESNHYVRFYGLPALATLALLLFWFHFRHQIPKWWIIAAGIILFLHYALFATRKLQRKWSRKELRELYEDYIELRHINIKN